MAIVMNGLNMSAQNGGSFWLYDTVTGLNVLAPGTQGDFSQADFSSSDFQTTTAPFEYLNISQKP